MQHETVAPGAVLAGRYRVEDLLIETVGARSWLAVDEILARSVAVHVLPAVDRRAWQLLEAARRSSTVPDGRFVRVLDAAEENGSVFVVREWVAGESLDAELGSGPLTPRRATWIARECAAAIAAAHEVGIPHLRLVPANVVLTSTGGVKILGLATDAALHEVTSLDPAADDVRDVGRILYACLVARWPDSSSEGLLEAPSENGRVLRPRQVRAGVPRPLDDLCGRIVNRRELVASGAAAPSAAELSTALSAVLLSTADAPAASTLLGDAPAPAVFGAAADGAPTAALPRSPDARGSSESPEPLVAPAGEKTAAPAAAPPLADTAGAAPPRRRGWSRTLAWLAVAVLMIGVAWLAYEIGRRGAESQAGGPTPSPTSTSPGTTPAAALQPLAISTVTDFDPVVDGGSGGENSAEAALAADDDPATVWETEVYHNNPEFGGLKPGVGLLLDLGGQVSVGKVTVSLIGTGTSVELRAAPGVDAVPESASGFDTFDEASEAGEQVTLRPGQPVSTRYLLVYLTSLPEDSPDRYRGRIAEIDVTG